MYNVHVMQSKVLFRNDAQVRLSTLSKANRCCSDCNKTAVDFKWNVFS